MKDYYYKKHIEYKKRMYLELGIDFNFYHGFVKPMIKKIKGNFCEYCKSEKDIQLHHSNLNNININTLKLLCRKCHENVHHKGLII